MNINIKELKKELSKVSGVNFFSPEYRDIFKRHLSGDKPTESDETAETETDIGETENSDNTDSGGESQRQEQSADDSDDSSNDANNSDSSGDTDNGDEQDSDVDDSQQTKDDADITLDNESQIDSQDNSAEEKALQRLLGDDGDGDSETDVAGEQYSSEYDGDGGETDIQTEDEAAAESGGDITLELLSTKLELELVRAGIREDRLETAKRLFMPEFKGSGGNVEQIRELIAQYPEWLGAKGGAQGFGMPLGDKADALTNEEKALKRMGIDPRN